MRLLATIKPEEVTAKKAKEFRRRQSARAVVFDASGNIALLHVTQHSYHKLPGGGIMPNEDTVAALRRECLEEIGCSIELTGELGRVIEYRPRYRIRQESFCYLARLVGTKGEPRLTNDELRDGFVTVWLPIHQAIETVASDRSDNYQWRFIQVRDLTFLQAAARVGKNRTRVL